MPIFTTGRWYDLDEYAEIICQLHDLSPKMNIISMLKEIFDKATVDPSFKPDELGDLSDERRQRLRVHVSMQILSLSVELTEDMAAICSAYAEARERKNKRVPEYLRDFRDPDGFYKEASRDIRFAARACGYDAIAEVEQAMKVLPIFQQIYEFRNKYKDWYNGYKHGQRTIPLAVSFPQDSQNQHWGLYGIPTPFIEQKNQIFVEASFLIAPQGVEEFVRMAGGVLQLWIDVRKIQYPQVFGHPIQ